MEVGLCHTPILPSYGLHPWLSSNNPIGLGAKFLLVLTPLYSDILSQYHNQPKILVWVLGGIHLKITSNITWNIEQRTHFLEKGLL
jgi:hypothetical protein